MRALRPLSWLYGGVVQAKNDFYDRGMARPRRLDWPVVSVGNISAGGSGKTPVVLALVEEMARRGMECDVLSRGYGRRSSGVRVVDPEGSADEFGDEPLLIARRTGVPVVVGENRYEAGLAAERLPAESSGTRIHILDDGFQHRRLQRDFDLVLLSTGDISDRLLPEGRLREPLSALVRADAIAATEHIQEVDFTGVPQWRMERRIFLNEHAPQYPLVFCGIARPQRLLFDLQAAGVRAAQSLKFADHHRYSGRDVERLLRLRDACGADGYLTTEKDLVRLGEARCLLEPISAVQLEVCFANADAVVSAILSAITAGRGPVLPASHA